MTAATNNEHTARAALELLYGISRELSAALDLRTVLHRVLFLSMKNVGAISGSIIVLDENGQPGESAFLMLGQTHDQTALQLKATYEHGLAGWVARHRESALIANTSKDERWLRRPDDAEDRTGAKSAVSVPIVAHEALVGVITLVHTQPGFFNTDHLDLVNAIADQAGAAISNARLFDHLQAAHRRYRELFEDSIDPIFITDWSGAILEINRQASVTIGQTNDQIRNTLIQDLHPVQWARVGAKFSALAQGETVAYESVLQPPGRREIPIQVHVRAAHTLDEASQLQWILRDITERKDLDSLREDLIAMVYHDLRSPLANIVSSLEVMSSMFEEDEVDETVVSLLGIALRSTDRIQRLTNSLLDINRLEAGQKIGERQVVDLFELATESAETVAPTAANRGLEIVVDVPRGQLVWIDTDMIRRVYINLIENAVKFSISGGQIVLGADPLDDRVDAWVADCGPGIPLEDQERIFEKFTRLKAEQGPRGLGLGLAFCRLAVNSHGGRIWVESQPGAGATFHFTLPVSGQAATPT